MIQKQFGKLGYVFKPSVLGAVVVFICVPLFIKLGFWQYDKAMLKRSIQAKYSSEVILDGSKLLDKVIDFKVLQYRHVKLFGNYAIADQVLIDNQVEGARVGYHVITPLNIKGSDVTVLVNRGWIPADGSRAVVPKYNTPTGEVQIEGQIWLPRSNVFTLETHEQKMAQETVWQYIDYDRYKKKVPALLPVIVKLDPASKAGGFVRNWQMPAEKITTHLGYAYQWFGFALASVLIYVVTSFKKRHG